MPRRPRIDVSLNSETDVSAAAGTSIAFQYVLNLNGNNLNGSGSGTMWKTCTQAAAITALPIPIRFKPCWMRVRPYFVLAERTDDSDCGYAMRNRVFDVEFTRQLLDDLAMVVNVDPKRVDGTGVEAHRFDENAGGNVVAVVEENAIGKDIAKETRRYFERSRAEGNGPHAERGVPASGNQLNYQHERSSTHHGAWAFRA